MKAIRKIECHHVLDGPVDASFSYSPGYLDLAYRYIVPNQQGSWTTAQHFPKLISFWGFPKKNEFILSFSGIPKNLQQPCGLSTMIEGKEPGYSSSLYTMSFTASMSSSPPLTFQNGWAVISLPWLVYHGWFLRRIVHSFGPVLPQLFGRFFVSSGVQKKVP